MHQLTIVMLASVGLMAGCNSGDDRGSNREPAPTKTDETAVKEDSFPNRPDGPNKKGDPSDRDRIQGVWTVVAEKRGEASSSRSGNEYTYIFDGDALTLTEPGETHTGTYKLDATKTPKEIDVSIMEMEGRKIAAKGIYRFEGEMLMVCLSDSDRPAEFTTTANDTRVLLRLIRADTNDQGPAASTLIQDRVIDMIQKGGGQIKRREPGGQVIGVDLSQTGVADHHLVHLNSLADLEVLKLCNTQITDDGLRYLQGMTTLDSVDLTGTQVSEEGVKKLQAALPNCRILH